MTDKIQVEELPTRPGERVVIGAIGPDQKFLTLFEIRKVQSTGKKKEHFDYYVDHLHVTRDVYFDAMQTAAADRFCPGCAVEDTGGEGEETLS